MRRQDDFEALIVGQMQIRVVVHFLGHFGDFIDKPHRVNKIFTDNRPADGLLSFIVHPAKWRFHNEITQAFFGGLGLVLNPFYY